MRTDVGSDLICNLIADTGSSSNQLAYIAISTDPNMPASGDEMPLVDEVDRLAATVVYTAGTGQLSFTATYTATSTITVYKAALSDSGTIGAGVLAFEGLNPDALDMFAGDTYSQTITVSLT